MGFRLSKIYTRTGDKGETGLGDGRRRGLIDGRRLGSHRREVVGWPGGVLISVYVVLSSHRSTLGFRERQRPADREDCPATDVAMIPGRG